VANPLPLGFLALAVATFGFSTVQLGWVRAEEGATIALATLVLTVPLQLLVSVMAFVRGDVAPATGMGILAGTWASVALTTRGSAPGSTSRGLAVLLIAAAVCMAVAAATAWSNRLGALVMGGAAVRFAVTAAYEWQAGSTWERAAGWVGLALAVLAVAVATTVALRSVAPPEPARSPTAR
jgi:succinate-acetate transporter protein